jgi:hypothetical protein
VIRQVKEAVATLHPGNRAGVRKAAQAEPKFALGEAMVELNLLVGKHGRLSLIGEGFAGHGATHIVKVYLKPTIALANRADPGS